MGYLLAFTAAASWGLPYALDQRALESLPVVKLYFFTSVFGVLVSTVLWLMSNRPLSGLVTIDPTQTSFPFLLLTLAVGALAGLSIFGSIHLLGATKAAILEISYPLFAALFSYLIFSQALSFWVGVGALLILAGTAVIVAWG
jgi:drug/metabolite transporter (DMT)-like permease